MCIIIVLAILIIVILFVNINPEESFNPSAYSTLMDYGNYGPYTYMYNDYYNEMPGITSIVKRCAAGPYTYSSNPTLSALCSTIPNDVLDKVDCRRVERVKYTSPAYGGGCGSYNSQMAPGYRVTGSPQLKYPVILDSIQIG